MRISPAILCLVITIACFVSSARAQQEPTLQERVAARRDLDQAKLELRQYWQIEYPRQRRQLDAAIELTRTEIDNYNVQLREYWPFTRFSTGQPFLLTLQNLRMCLKEAELRLNDLIAERNNLVRFHADQFRVLESQVYEARLRVAEIEARLAETEQPPTKQQ